MDIVEKIKPFLPKKIKYYLKKLRDKVASLEIIKFGENLFMILLKTILKKIQLF